MFAAASRSYVGTAVSQENIACALHLLGEPHLLHLNSIGRHEWDGHRCSLCVQCLDADNFGFSACLYQWKKPHFLRILQALHEELASITL